MDRHVNKLWSAGYLSFHQPLPASDQISPLYILDNEIRDSTIHDWILQQKPDAIITIHAEVLQWLKKNPWAEKDIVLAGLDISPVWGNCPGILQKPRILGAAAIDLLAGQLQRNEQGLPREPITLMMEGEWRDGRSPWPPLRHS
jgi:hypothetical protein